MIGRERTIQQLDPLGALGARTYSVVAAVSVVLLALGATWVGRDELSSPVIASLAILVLAAAAAIVIAASDPVRSAMSHSTFLLVMLLAFVASVLNVASMWGTNLHLHDDWGPAAIGILLLAFAPYRSARELAVAGIVIAIFTGFTALVESDSRAYETPVFVLIVVAATPVLAFSLAASSLVSVVVRSVRRWRERALASVRAFASEAHNDIARSVQHNRVTILNRDVVPFFEDVLHGGDIGAAERDRASMISDSIRSVMVAEVDRTWLDGVVAQVGSAALSAPPGPDAVEDDERIATGMTTDQRTAVRALLVAMFAHPDFDPTDFGIRLTRSDSNCEATMHARFITSEGAVRAALGPYLAVLRVVFQSLESEFAEHALTVRITYDER